MIDEVDLMMDTTGQPVPLASGAESLVMGIDGFFQDIRNEAVTVEGECFYAPDYGWSLLDFLHRDFNEMENLRIKTRVIEKLKMREEINQHSIQVNLSQEQDGAIQIHVEFKIKNADVSYQMDLSIDGAEVSIID